MPIPKKKENKKHLSAKDRIYETVKLWIIKGQLEPLEKISDIEIGEYFKVSRTPVREAFQMLEKQKLVKSYPGKSTIVTEINMWDLDKWYFPMMYLQELAVKLAIKNACSGDIDFLSSLNKIFERETNSSENAFGILTADKNFHQCILDLADNEYINDFCETLWIHIQRSDYAFFRKQHTFSNSISVHNSIIEAFKNQNTDAAASAMHENWENTIVQLKTMSKL